MAGDDITLDLLVRHNEDSDDRVVHAVKRYMNLLDEGGAPSVDAYLSKHVDIADELRPALEGLALVHRAGPPKSSALVAPDAEFTAKPIGDFQIVGEIGRGGMGVVYEAIQLSLGRRVALKVLPFASGLDEVRLQRFRNEAHAAAALHHTNIVPVYAVGSERGIHYYAMQLIDGQTVGDLIEEVRRERTNGKQETRKGFRSSTLPLASASQSIVSGHSDRGEYVRSMVKLTIQAALALDYAHGYGVIHRDIKPANLLLDSAGKLWVTDFGLAQVQDAASPLTRTGDPMGTLRYMSPEQAAGNRAVLDHRTDIYSLGVTLYEVLTLQPAIRGEGYREMLNEIAEQEPLAPKSIDPWLPIELDTIIRRAIAKLPSERYATSSDFADDLQSWLHDKPIKAKPPTAWERLAKWRRRNSGLVAVASGILLLSTLALSATTLMVWREQRATQNALARETEQRRLAERSFQQARSAVDTFSNLSESELAYRADLQDLRRSFLETSLEYYRDFLSVRSNDPTLASELSATSARVEGMVNELRILDNLFPLLQLEDPAVREELAIPAEKATILRDAIFGFEGERRSLANQNPSGLKSENLELTALLHDFDAFVSEQLTDEQLKRLRQISLQRQLPFAFKTSEVIAVLGLTSQQTSDINRIIEETRPGRGDNFLMGPNQPPRPQDFDHRGPPDGKPPRRFGFGGDGPFSGGPPGGRGDGPPNHFGRDDRRPPRDMSQSPVTQKTVKHILEILTPVQRQKWNELVGRPFNP